MRGSANASRSAGSREARSGSRKRGTPELRQSASKLSGWLLRRARTRIGSSQPLAAATVPRSVPMPMRYAAAPKACRASLPRFVSPRAAISVAVASPTCELCAQTTARAFGPRCSSTDCSVANMCRSRRFQDSRAP